MILHVEISQVFQRHCSSKLAEGDIKDIYGDRPKAASIRFFKTNISLLDFLRLST